MTNITQVTFISSAHFCLSHENSFEFPECYQSRCLKDGKDYLGTGVESSRMESYTPRKVHGLRKTAFMAESLAFTLPSGKQ